MMVIIDGRRVRRLVGRQLSRFVRRVVAWCAKIAYRRMRVLINLPSNLASMSSDARKVEKIGKVVELLLFQSFSLLTKVYKDSNALHMLAKKNHLTKVIFHVANSIVELLFSNFVLFEGSEPWNKLVTHRDSLHNPVVE